MRTSYIINLLRHHIPTDGNVTILLLCAQSPLGVTPASEYITVWRCCHGYLTSGHDLAWEDSSENTMRLSMKLSHFNVGDD